MIIHADMPSVATTIILLLVWGSNIEYMIGFLRTILIFMFSSYTANFYGLYFSKSLFETITGADGGAFGLLGAGLGYSIFNWFKIKQSFLVKLSVLWCILILFIFAWIFGVSS